MRIVSSGKVLNSPEFYKKKTIKRRIKMIFIVLVVISIVSALVYLSRQESFLINEVVVVEKNVINRDEIIKTTRDLLLGNYMGIVPRANAFIYPKKSIENILLQDFPRLESVKFDLTDSQKLNISLKERTPFALYCASALNPSLTSDCYFLDKDGFIFSLAPSFTGAVYFVYSTVVSIENPVGKRYVDTNEFHALIKFVDSLKVFDIYPVALGLGDGEYSLALPNSGQILWKRDGNLELVYSNLEAFFSDEAINAQSDFLNKISYLDLRTENKIRWKFKEE